VILKPGDLVRPRYELYLSEIRGGNAIITASLNTADTCLIIARHKTLVTSLRNVLLFSRGRLGWCWAENFSLLEAGPRTK